MRLRRAQSMVLATLLASLLTLAAGPQPTRSAPVTTPNLISAPDGSLFLIYAGQRHAVEPRSLRAFGIAEVSARPRKQATLIATQLGAPVPDFANGTFLRAASGARFLLLDGVHEIPDDATFAAYGWAGGAGFPAVPIEDIDGSLLATLPLAAPIAPAAPANDAARFDAGYCTAWVARRRAVPWNGNAIEWYANAQALGFAVGTVPVPGAILVRQSATWGAYGHVAYVESVHGNSFTVSEMNVNQVGELTTATHDFSGGLPANVIGFVYWRYGPVPAAVPRPPEGGASATSGVVR